MREDWESSTLGAICEIVSGNTPKGIENINNIGDYHFYKVGDMNSFGNEITMTTSNYNLSEDDIKNLKIKVYPKGTVIFPKRGGAILTNKKRKLSKDATFDLNIMGVLPNEIVIGDFLYYWFLKLDLSKIYDGSNVPQINNKNIVPLGFLLPPLPEQRAIVKKMESLFSSLDAGIADLKKAQQQIKMYRQAVLKKAFEGITETIILNDAGAWKGGGTPSTQNKDFWENGNINWVSSQDVKTKYIEDTERKITSIAIDSSSTKWIEKNALLFVVRSGILRRIFPIAIAKVDLCVNQDIQTLTLNERYLTEFVYWYLMGNEYDIRHNCAKDGTTVESIDVSKLKKYKLPTCTLDEQNEIVKQIESRLSVCDSIEQNIAASLEKSEALRQSILKKAFEGNLLTAQELAECKQAADYEPASVLLERIKAEQNTTTAKPGKKKASHSVAKYE